MTLRRHTLPQGAEYIANAPHGVIRVLTGAVRLDAASIDAGAYLAEDAKVTSEAAHSTFLEFQLWADAPKGAFEMVEEIDLPAGPAMLRLDEVSFGPGVCAYRHVHPGPGIRCLIEGELKIIADSHVQTMQTGQAWFEAAGSPVRAEASTEHPQTTFVRAMILPVEFEGQPTIRILDPNEAELPRLQKTTRHIDQPI